MRVVLGTLLLAAVARAEISSAADDAAAHEMQLRRDIDTYVRSATVRDVSLGLPVLAKATPGVTGWIDVRVDVWLPSLSGSMRTDADSDSVDFVNDLGLGDEEVAIMPQVILSLGGLGLKVDGFFYQTDGSGTVQGDFTFGGVTFTVNEDIDSEIQVDNYRFLMTIPILKGGPIALYLQGGISYYHLEGTVTSDTFSATDTADVPIPVGGILAQAKFFGLLVEADVTGLVIEYDGVEGSVIDAKLSVGYAIAKVLALRAGYRIVRFDGGDGDFDIDTTFDGFFVGASITF
jgi:hypothetical protein